MLALMGDCPTVVILAKNWDAFMESPELFNVGVLMAFYSSGLCRRALATVVL